MKKWLTVYVVNLYLLYLIPLILSFISAERLYENKYYILTVWFVVFVLTHITGLGNIIYIVVSRIRKQYIENSLKIITRVKFALIPFYIFNFFTCLLVFGAFLNPFLMWLLPIIIPMAVLFVFGTLITTSLYAVFAITDLKKEGIIKNSTPHYILQFIFVLDIVDSIYLYIKKYKPHYGKAKTFLLTSLPILIPVSINVILCIIVGITMVLNGDFQN